MNKNRVLGISAALAVSLSACQQYDITQNFSENTRYADSFIEEFGNPDPLQDWSMATQVTLNVVLGDADGEPEGEIKVYSSDPYAPEARVLAGKDINGTELTMVFEAPSHCVFLYVLYNRANGYIQYKPVKVEGGQCAVSFDIYELEEASGARVNLNTQTVNSVEYWKGKVPENQYNQIIPADAVSISGYKQEVNSYEYGGVKNLLLSNATIENMNMYSGDVNIYVTGNCTISRWNCMQNCHTYIMEGATLNFETSTSFAQTNTTWTVCDDAKLIFKDKVEFAQNQTVYNKGRIQAPELIISNDAKFYNDESLEVKGNLKVANAQPSVLINKGTVRGSGDLTIVGEVYNEGEMTFNGNIFDTTNSSILFNRGTLKGNNLNIEGSSTFINDHTGETEIRNLSLVNSGNSTWHNHGHYTTGYLTFNSSSANWINDCYLKVINKLEIVLGGELPTNNSYIEAGSMYMNNAGIYLGSNSQLIVNGTAEMGWNSNYGIISNASGDSWAIFKASKISQNGNGYINYVGNLLIDCEDHFAAGQWGYPGIIFKGNAKMAPGGDNYSIPGSDCNEPYEASTPARPEEIPTSWIMACEDLGGAYDYDFNDVVFSISHINDSKYATITPLAAGGTLASVLYYKDIPINGSVLRSEIHSLLNFEQTSISGMYNKLNTGRGHSQDYSGNSVKILLDDPNASIDEIASQITVHVIEKDGDLETGDYKESMIVRRPDTGAMPQIILLPDNWIWPTEKTSIQNAYPDFKNWVKEATLTDWASNAVNSNLVKNY